MAEASGFWSYVHEDDDAEGGRIRRLADNVRDEYGVLTGDVLRLFLDRDALEWGDNWRARIKEALAATTFFIPIITPRFFLSQECRSELVGFLGEARSRGLEELLLPILYVPVPALDDPDSPDEAVRVIADTQWEDWRELRLLDEGSADHRRAVNRLARRIVEVSQRVELIPAGRPRESADRPGDVDPPDTDDEPGYLEMMAGANQKVEALVETVSALAPAIEGIATVTNEQTAELNRLVAEDASIGERLAAVRRVAEALDEPAQELETLGSRYASQVLELDPDLLGLFRMLEEDEPAVSPEDVAGFLDGIPMLAQASREAGGSLTGLIDAMQPVTRWSRDLRRPLRKAEAGLRSVLDAQGILDEWESHAQRLRTPQVRKSGS